jgi:GNAT superfamily N-acetyltransferase
MTQDPSRDIRLVDATEVDSDRLRAFMDEAFGSTYALFMAEHAKWWHRGSHNRWVALCDGEVAGCRGYIPAVCLLDGKEISGIWAVDLFVLPRFRGLGLQKLLDQRLEDISPLVMSFPGDVGATIYAKQGHLVRESVDVHSLNLAPKPLVPPVPGSMAMIRHVASRSRELGVRRATQQAFRRARALVTRTQSARYMPRHTEIVTSFDPDALEALFLRHVDRNVAITHHSADYLRWRYLEAPYRAELAFFLSSSAGKTNQCAIVRYPQTAHAARILDVFGNLADEEALADTLRSVLRDAAHRGVSEITVVASSAPLARTLAQLGFARTELRKFRWRALDSAIHGRLSTIDLQWALCDIV